MAVPLHEPLLVKDEAEGRALLSCVHLHRLVMMRSAALHSAKEAATHRYMGTYAQCAGRGPPLPSPPTCCHEAGVDAKRATLA